MSLMKKAVTGAAAVSFTVAPGVDWQLEHIRIHLSAAGGAGNLTATMDAAEGAAYDAVLLTQDMTAITDFVWPNTLAAATMPKAPIPFQAGDELDFAWANAGTKTYGIEVYWSLRH